MKLFSWIHNHFVPNEENGLRPHFLRSENAQTLLILILISQVFFLIFTFVVAPKSKQVAAVIASTLIEQTNIERLKSHINSVTVNEKLTLSAQMKANDMAARGYFSHNTPDGETPWVWFERSGYIYQNAGENLAVNFIESKDVTQAWMNSPTHRDNLLNQKFKEIGIATANGKYKGRDAIFVVQHFGTQPESILARLKEQPVPSDKQKIATPTTKIPKVLGVEITQEVSPKAYIVSLLPKFTHSIQFVIFLLTLVALILAIVIKIRHQHPMLIANGLMIIAITVGIAFMNIIITQGTI